MLSERQINQQEHQPYWGEVCKEFYPHLQRHALVLARKNYYDAEDLVQDTVCRALRYCADPAHINNPLNYLLTIMRHVWVDKWKGQNKGNADSLDHLLDEGWHPAIEPEAPRIVEDEEFQNLFVSRLGLLTRREKHLLDLYFAGYKCKEIADEMKEDVRLIRSDLNAVKAKVRYRLKQKH
jgi:RNA polymerase sigma factor (sigma-70 family)